MKKLSIEKIAYGLLLIGLSLECFYVLWDKSSWIIPSEGILFRFSFLFFALKILCTKYSKREWGVLILMGLIGLVSYKVSSRNDMLRVVVMIAACKGVDYKKILRYIFAVTAAGCSLLILLSLFGIQGEIAKTTEYRKGVIETRYVLGMGHPNALHCMVMVLIFLGIYLWWNQLNWWKLLLLFGMNAAVFKLTDSRIGFLVTAAGILGAVLLLYQKKLRDKPLYYVLVAVGILLLVGITLLVAYYGMIYDENGYWGEPHYDQIMAFDNKFLTGRLKSAYGYWNSGLRFFLPFSAPDLARSIDLGFYKLFLNYGIVPTILYIVMSLLLVLESYRKKDYGLLIFMAVWSLYTFVEAHAISEYIGRNLAYFMFAGVLPHLLGCEEHETYYFFGLPAALMHRS